MKVKAIYRKSETNPFSLRPEKQPVIKAEFPDGTPKDKIFQMAREATPKGMELVNVVLDDERDSPIPD